MDFRLEVERDEARKLIGVRVFRLQPDGSILILTQDSVEGGVVEYSWVEVFEEIERPWTFTLPWFIITAELADTFVGQLVEALKVDYVPRVKDAVLVAKNEHIDSLKALLLKSEYVRIERGLAVDVRKEEGED